MERQWLNFFTEHSVECIRLPLFHTKPLLVSQLYFHLTWVDYWTVYKYKSEYVSILILIPSITFCFVFLTDKWQCKGYPCQKWRRWWHWLLYQNCVVIYKCVCMCACSISPWVMWQQSQSVVKNITFQFIFKIAGHYTVIFVKEISSC